MRHLRTQAREHVLGDHGVKHEIRDDREDVDVNVQLFHHRGYLIEEEPECPERGRFGLHRYDHCPCRIDGIIGKAIEVGRAVDEDPVVFLLDRCQEVTKPVFPVADVGKSALGKYKLAIRGD